MLDRTEESETLFREACNLVNFGISSCVRQMKIGNQFVYVLKMSSLVSIIGIGDLTRKANELVVTTYRPLEIYTFLILEYLVLILVVSFLVRKLEKRLQKD